MSKVSMTVHQALAEVKKYSDRLDKQTELDYCKAVKKSTKNIAGFTQEEYAAKMIGNLKSIKALLKNKDTLKRAIIKSNAETKVTIAGKEYTVAEAIQRKTSIIDEKRFLNTLEFKYNVESNTMEKENALLPGKLETYLQSVLGNEKQRTADEVENYTKMFEERNSFILINPNKIGDYIGELEKEISDFETEVDFKLSESNATTVIEVEFDD